MEIMHRFLKIISIINSNNLISTYYMKEANILKKIIFLKRIELHQQYTLFN